MRWAVWWLPLAGGLAAQGLKPPPQVGCEAPCAGLCPIAASDLVSNDLEAYGPQPIVEIRVLEPACCYPPRPEASNVCRPGVVHLRYSVVAPEPAWTSGEVLAWNGMYRQEACRASPPDALISGSLRAGVTLESAPAGANDPRLSAWSASLPLSFESGRHRAGCATSVRLFRMGGSSSASIDLRLLTQECR